MVVITYDFSTVHRSSAVVSRYFSRIVIDGGKVRASRVTPSIGAAKRRLETFTPDEYFFFFFRPTFPCVRSRWTSPAVLLHTSALSVSLSLCGLFFKPENRILRSRAKAAKLEQQEQEEEEVRARLPSMWGRGTMVKVKRL